MDKEIYARHKDFAEAKEELKQSKSLLNKGGKKSSFSLYKKPRLKFKHEVFDIRELKELYLCSDGYYRAFNIFHLYKNRRQLFSSSHDLQDVYNGIIKANKSDPKREKYPRLLPLDDISAVRVVF